MFSMDGMRTVAINRILKRQEKDLVIIKTVAKEILQDSDHVMNILQKFKDWFFLNGEKLYRALVYLETQLTYGCAMDIFRDFGLHLNDESLHVLYEIVAHYGDLTFSFANMMALAENVKAGEIATIGVDNEIVKSKFIGVDVFTLNGSIPYNPLNMHLVLDEGTTIRQLIHHIKHNFDWPSRDIKIYDNSLCDEELNEDAVLSEIKSQRNLGTTDVLDLYMDFTMGYIDNPLIFSDEYFETRTIDKVLDAL
ncbi:unnamed protein product [Mesocestoides corti]|uniref:Ribonucleoside-diphosphate reductase n=1 Tax=Mesocestoides corti TaxID=53468 RepID=A0A0R3U840_MESCO|nr:unnamed protein product [Mesocestoides corti]